MVSGRLAGLDDAGGDAERPGRGRHQQRVRLARRADDQSPRRELVLDQPIGGGGIGHPQQRLRQHHQRKPLLGGQRIGMEEILDAAEPAGPRPDALDQARGIGIDPRLGRGRTRAPCEQLGRDRLVGRRIGRAKRRLRAFGHHRYEDVKAFVSSRRHRISGGMPARRLVRVNSCAGPACASCLALCTVMFFSAISAALGSGARAGAVGSVGVRQLMGFPHRLCIFG